MQGKQKLSLWSAVLINVNIMMGVGIFINTVVLTKLSGLLGFLSYLLVGILMLPLVISMAKLVSAAPDGGFYAYGKTFLKPFTGFLASWSYFWGKLASCTLMVHTFATLLQIFIPATKSVSILAIDLIVISLFMILNTFNIKTGTKIQAALFSLKIIPILFIILAGFALINAQNITFDNALFAGFPATLALVLYAFSGFEASCSLSSSIENAEKNASKAILISYGITVCACLLYQFLSFAAIGPEVAGLTHFSGIYDLILGKIISPAVPVAHYIKILLYVAMAASSLGGAYGIMFSNNWNMFQLAKGNHVAGASYLKMFNKHNIPYFCVILEGLICIMYVLITQGNQLPLQQIGAFGCIIAYTLSVAALAKGINSKKISFSKNLCYLAIGNCLILIISTLQSFIATANALALGLFVSILTLGISMFYLKK